MTTRRTAIIAFTFALAGSDHFHPIAAGAGAGVDAIAAVACRAASPINTAAASRATDTVVACRAVAATVASCVACAMADAGAAAVAAAAATAAAIATGAVRFRSTAANDIVMIHYHHRVGLTVRR